MTSYKEFHHRSGITYLVAGTTCATVLTQAIFTEGCKAVAAGINAMDLRRGINMAVDAVISDLKIRAVMISTPEEITQAMMLLNKSIFISGPVS